MKGMVFVWVFFTGLAFGQSEKDQNFLRNYKAPDFSFSRLDLSLNATGIDREDEGLTRSSVGGYFRGAYQYYINSKNYQGEINGGLNSSYNRSQL